MEDFKAWKGEIPRLSLAFCAGNPGTWTVCCNHQHLRSRPNICSVTSVTSVTLMATPKVCNNQRFTTHSRTLLEQIKPVQNKIKAFSMQNLNISIQTYKQFNRKSSFLPPAVGSVCPALYQNCQLEIQISSLFNENSSFVMRNSSVLMEYSSPGNVKPSSSFTDLFLTETRRNQWQTPQFVIISHGKSRDSVGVLYLWSTQK